VAASGRKEKELGLACQLKGAQASSGRPAPARDVLRRSRCVPVCLEAAKTIGGSSASRQTGWLAGHCSSLTVEVHHPISPKFVCQLKELQEPKLFNFMSTSIFLLGSSSDSQQIER
jgi:hypothetical protein